MQKKNWVPLLLVLLLVLLTGLMSACSSGDEEPDLEDEDLPEVEENEAAVSAEDGLIVMQIGFDFGPGTIYDAELVEFYITDGVEDYYRYQLTYNDEIIEPTVLIRHRDGALFTYYEADGTINALEDDPILGPYMSDNIKPDPNDTGHGLPGAVDLDEFYSEYDAYYEGYDLDDSGATDPADVDPSEPSELEPGELNPGEDSPE